MRQLFRILVCCLGLALAIDALAGGARPLDLNRLKPDVSPFLAAGCVDNDQARGFVCPPEVHRRFGCGDMRLAAGLGGFGLPIATCVGTAKGVKAGAGVAHVGCMLPLPVTYVVYTSKGFRVLRSPAELIGIAAPIDTPEEAASLVMALDPSVDQAPPAPGPDDDVRVRGGGWREASAVAGEGNIAVRLFKRQVCGCGTHPVHAVEYEVSPAGQIAEASRKLLQQMKQEICID